MTDESIRPSFWQLNAGALLFNGLVAVLMGLYALALAIGLDYNTALTALIVVFFTLAIGTLGNLICLVFKLVTKQYDQVLAYALALLVVGSLFCALWAGVSNSNIGKAPGG